MGIHGLWRLLEPTGRDVTLESLENKVLAIDVSLWLYQAQQGSAYGGSNTANSHLLILFHRISKLLFYRIKPVFVFDGVAPGLKKKTISARKQKKQVATDRAEEMRQQLLLSLAKSGVVDPAYIKAQTHSAGPSPKKVTPKKGSKTEVEEEDLYKLPPLPNSVAAKKEDELSLDNSESDDDDRFMSYYESDEESRASVKSKTKGKIQGGWKKWNSWIDPHEVDLQSDGFKSLPVEVRREILTDLKEARKESSWGRLHKMPKDLGNFSNFQMSRLLHRRKVQEVLEKVEEEISSSEAHGASLGELEAILVEKGVTVEMQTSQRIASDESKGFILVSGLKDQKKAKEEDSGKKVQPSKLAEVKEEPEVFDVEEEEFDKLLCDGSKSKITTRDEFKSGKSSQPEIVDSMVSLPTLKEEEMLSSNQIVKKFLMSVTETSDDAKRNVDESGEFESISNALDEESCTNDLSQGEILAIIQNQGMNEGSSSAGKVDSIKVEGTSEVHLQTKPSLARDDVVEVIEVPTSDEGENEGLTQEQIMKIIREQKETQRDVKVKVADVPMIDLESVSTPEMGNKIISNPMTPAGTDDEAIIEKVSVNSDSDESDFLEVEDGSESSRPASEKSDVHIQESKKEVEASKPEVPSKMMTSGTKKLEVVVDLTASSGITDDIFADVFTSEEPKKNEESVTRILPSEDTASTPVLGLGEKDGMDDKPSEFEGGVTYIEDTSASDDDVIEEQEIVAENPPKDVELPVQREQVTELTEEEQRKLTLELRKKELEGIAGVTDRARIESQELLGLFGVPWIVAPYEAEAQCAFLELTTASSPRKGSFSRSLVEGTVTEDSDVWAFGASRVYRHVFDRKRTRVRVYSKQEVERKLGIDRIRMIQLALLTGSDYTEGIPGIGTVSALEILAAFPGEKEPNQYSPDPEIDAALSGLQHFADWWKRVERNEKEGTPVGHSYYDPPEGIAKTLRRRLCSCLKAADTKQGSGSLLPPGFPSRAVVQAYLKPAVDGCTDAFTWLKPDEAALRSFARLHFGWTEERINSILRPLFSRLKLADSVDRKQMSLNSYFSRVNAIPNVIDTRGSNLGVRTKKALERISGKCEEVDCSPPKKKGRRVTKRAAGSKAKESVAQEEERVISDNDFDMRESPGKQKPVPVVSNVERVICEYDYDRRESSGKLELLRKKFSKQLAQIKGSRTTKTPPGEGKTEINVPESPDGECENLLPSTPKKKGRASRRSAGDEGKESVVFEEERAISDDDFDMSVSPRKRKLTAMQSKEGRITCEDDCKMSGPAGKPKLSEEKFSEESVLSMEPEPSISAEGGKALNRIAGKCEESVPSSSKDSVVDKEAVVDESLEMAILEEEMLMKDVDFDAVESLMMQQPLPEVPKEERVICEDDYDRRDPTGKLAMWRKKFAKDLAKMKRPRASKSRVSLGPGPSSRPASNSNTSHGNRAPVTETGFASSLYSKEKIPQRERDNDSALQSKLKAIEVMRKSSIGTGKRPAQKKSNVRQSKKLMRQEVCLSESSDSN